MKKLVTRRAFIPLCATIVLALVGGVAYATIPAANGAIDACYDPGSRQLRVIDTDAGETCRSQEASLSWNQTGPPGPIGPQGPRGPSDGYIANLLPSEATSISSTGTTNVISLSLPAGDYMLSASVHVRRLVAGVSTVSCDHRVGGGPFAFGYTERLDGNGDAATIALTAGIHLESDATVHVSCFTDADGNQADFGDLGAISVATLHRQ